MFPTVLLASAALACTGMDGFCTSSAECCTSRCDGAHRCRPTLEKESPRIEETGGLLDILAVANPDAIPGVNGVISQICAKIPVSQRADFPLCKNAGDSPDLAKTERCEDIGQFCSFNSQCCSGRCGSIGRCRPPDEEENLGCTGENGSCWSSEECCSARCDGAHRCRPTSDLTTPTIEEVGELGLGCVGEGGYCAINAQCCSARCGGTGECRPPVEEETNLGCTGENGSCWSSAQCCSARCDGAHRCRPTWDLATPRIEELNRAKLE